MVGGQNTFGLIGASFIDQLLRGNHKLSLTAYHWDSGTSSWQTHTGWTYSGYSDPVWIGLSVYTIQNSIVSGSFSNFVCTDGGDTRADSGTYTSPVYDAGRTVTWGDLSWEETLPSGTDIELQMAFSDDEEGPWNYVGPDGTSGTKFTTSTGQSVYGSTSSRYCRYKAYLTGDGTDTPTLGTVELGFSGNLDSQIRTFAFDDAGNMTEKVTKSDSSLIEETRTYNDLNQITQNQIDDGTTVTTWTFTHDSNGNMTSKSDGTDTYTYVWNEDNQLESVELNSSPVVDYVYDAGSRMLQRAEGSITTNFHWDGWDLVREEKDDGVNVEVTNYLVPHGEVLAFERDDEWFYLHGDGITSTQLVTDESGAQVGRMVYGAWGETLSSSESMPGVLDVGFVGGLGVRNDAATGLIWMRHRWYDCELGRFISRDPIGLIGDTNLYRYTTNPVSQVDPSGLVVQTKVAKEMLNLLLGGAEVIVGTAIALEPTPSGEVALVDGARRIRSSLIALGIIGTTVAIVNAGSTPLNGPSTYSANSDLKELGILGRQQQNLGKQASQTKEDDDCPKSLYHYSSASGMRGIVSDLRINASIPVEGKKNAVDGQGVYLTSIGPESGLTPGQLSRLMKMTPAFWAQFVRYAEIDVTGYHVIPSSTGGGSYFISTGTDGLDVSGRILRVGITPGAKI